MEAIGVHHEEDYITASRIPPPFLPVLRLTPQVPALHLDPASLDHLHVQTDRGRCLYRSAAPDHIEQSGLSTVLQAHQDNLQVPSIQHIHHTLKNRPHGGAFDVNQTKTWPKPRHNS